MSVFTHIRRTAWYGTACVCAMAGLAFEAGAGAVSSKPTTLVLDPSQSVLWGTMPTGDLTLEWTMPDGAQKAALAVTGPDYSYAGEESADTQVTLSDLVADRVYDLKLTFDNGTVWTARLGRIPGSGVASAPCRLRLADSGTRAWQRERGVTVVPVPVGAESLMVDGAPEDLDPWCRWCNWTPTLGDTSLQLHHLVSGGLDGYVYVPGGLLLLLR